jgi:polysaccharide biosynthesis protein PslG
VSPLGRTPRVLVQLLIGIVIGATLTPLIMRASQQFFALAPGDSIVVSCETSIGSTVQGDQARLDCAATGAAQRSIPTASAAPAGLAVRLGGLGDGQQARGTLTVEALVSGGAADEVVFTLDGPQPARHTERRAPYFFLGDDEGRPRGWDTTTFADGDYRLTVTVTDASGRSTSASARLSVANGGRVAQSVGAPQLNAPAAPASVLAAGTLNSGLQFGVAAHLFYIDREPPLSAARDIGFGWIRQQIHWKDIEGPTPGNYAWGELDPLVEEVHASGFKLLLSVVRSPGFHTADGGDGLPEEPRALGDFLAALTERYSGKVQAIEVWNEQNLAHENGGLVTVEHAGHYVELLKAAYARIKAVDRNMIVLAAPPSSTGVTDPLTAVDDIAYLRAMYEYDGGVIRNYFDAQAVHPGAASNPPETFPADNPSAASGWTEHPSFYFRHIEDVRALMVDHGLADKPVWITEFGWATQNTSPGYEFGNQVSLDEQAAYTEGAMRWTRERYPWVEAMFVWNLNFAPLKAQEGQALHEQASFSLLDGAGQPRPAYRAVRRFLAEVRGG